MRRWNGWGDEKIEYPLPEDGREFLRKTIGTGDTAEDVPLDRVLADVPPGRLPVHPLVIDHSMDRLMHSRGQSMPDWIALRTGRVGQFTDGVAYPTSDEEIRSLIKFGQDNQVLLVPFGGGTSVVGHINPVSDRAPVLTIDLSKMNHLVNLDKTSRLAVFEAGSNGPEIEQQLGRHGFTLGHFPQSFELSTVGGWIATRSSGQQSYFYGRIEDLFAGGHLETPVGPLELPPFPASAAGPDLRQLVMGSEGRYGILTRAEVRIHPIAEREAFFGAFFHQWGEGLQVVREIAQARIPVSMARLSDSQETATTLILSGKSSLVKWADRGLRLLRFGAGRCLMIYGITADQENFNAFKTRADEVILHGGGLIAGTIAGKAWQKSRFLSPYLRNSLWEAGYAIDTLETALPWRGIESAAVEITQAIRICQEKAGERSLVMCHLSHLYEDGASIYITYLFRRMADPDHTLDRWKAMKSAASQAVIQRGGTISHQHGVGADHKGYLPAEKGAEGIKALQGMAQIFDPQGIMNPGKLID